jgi:uncharacterized protein (TIGR02001 family)
VAIFDLSYDHSSGVYAGLSASAVASAHEGPEPLSLQENIGYARQLSSGVTLDLGVMNSNYTRYASSGQAASYAEVYAGVITKAFSTRLSYSPNYLRGGASTFYGEVEKVVQPAPNWRLTAHVGVLAHVGAPGPTYSQHVQYDWRLGLARELGPVTLQAAWTSGGPGDDFYDGRAHSRSTLIFGATWIL